MTPATVLMLTYAAGASADTTTLIVAFLALIGSAGTAILTFRTAGRANATSDRKVDLEEHRDAIDRLKKIIEEQDRHVDRFRAQLDRVQEQLAKEQDVSSVLRNQIRGLQDQVNDLSRSRQRLEEMISLTRPPTPRPE